MEGMRYSRNGIRVAMAKNVGNHPRVRTKVDLP